MLRLFVKVPQEETDINKLNAIKEVEQAKAIKYLVIIIGILLLYIFIKGI